MDNSELDEVVGEFITESHENLDQLDQELVRLEQHADPDVLARIFRTIHTIKGTSGFLGFGRLEAVTHVGENLLSRLRDGELRVTTEITSGLLAMVDAVREILGDVEATGDEADRDYVALIARLEALDAPVDHPGIEDAAIEDAVADDTVTEDAAADDTVIEGEPAEVIAAPVPLRPVPDLVEAASAALDDSALAGRPIGERLVEQGLITEEQLEDALHRQAAGDPRHVGELLVEEEAVSPTDVVEVLRAQTDDRGAAATDTIRVDVGLLDDLMNLVGELVLARNQILQFTQQRHDPAFLATSQRLNLITTELQEGVMKTRMQPIENVWNKFPRVVRDLSVSCGKHARLEMDGKHTELDKTLLEAIKDPLTHLVRNAVDHGLETPEARRAAGKPAEGVVRLRAYHEGGQVIIEISDDGAGIDAAAIRRKAVQKGLLTADEASARSDRDVIGVIFQPGFSTAEQVSNISGRGVGMDVVRTNIEAIGGSVDVQTVVGAGTTFKVKIPLTLAIIPALLVTCGGDRYAIPQVSLLELVRLDGLSAESGIEWIQGVPVHRLRGRLLPLVFLDQVFGDRVIGDVVVGDVVGAPPTGQRDAVNIVVVQADDHEFGLVVDEISDTAEIVVKPLGRLLKHVSAFAGATIMGDGRVALILDVLGIADHVGLSSSHRGALGRPATGDETAAARSDQLQRLLLCGVGDRRFALLLSAVARLEEFAPGDVETASHRPVVQYRGEILNLVDLGAELGVAVRRTPDQPMQVVVYNESARTVGLIVDEIYDIVEESLELSSQATAHGIAGSAIVQGAVIDVVDLDAVLRTALPPVTTRVEVAA